MEPHLDGLLDLDCQCLLGTASFPENAGDISG
jgi:hypothetical protein